jgi:hypothetical protein
MQVDALTKEGALDITWVRLKATMRDATIFRKIVSGKGIDEADVIAMRKQQQQNGKL